MEFCMEDGGDNWEKGKGKREKGVGKCGKRKTGVSDKKDKGMGCGREVNFLPTSVLRGLPLYEATFITRFCGQNH
jgi:hypothetical protein